MELDPGLKGKPEVLLKGLTTLLRWFGVQPQGCPAWLELCCEQI